MQSGNHHLVLRLLPLCNIVRDIQSHAHYPLRTTAALLPANPLCIITGDATEQQSMTKATTETGHALSPQIALCCKTLPRQAQCVNIFLCE